MPTIQIHVLGWLIAASIASWLAYETWGRSQLGMAVDWLVGLAGAGLGVLLWSLINWLVPLLWPAPTEPQTGQVNGGATSAPPPDLLGQVTHIDWWVSISVAFVCAWLLIGLSRTLFRVRPSP